MFDGEIKESLDFAGQLARCMGQLVFAYPLIAVSSIPLFWLFSGLSIDGNLGHGIIFGGFGALIFLYVGIFFGYVLAFRVPSLIRTGCWIWVVPTAFIFWDVVPTLWRSGFVPRFLEYVYATGSNEGLGLVLLTFPLCACVGYSLGIFLVKSGQNRNRGNARRRPLRAVVVWMAAFTASLALMVRIERTMVASHEKLAVAVRNDGTAFVMEPTSLCGPVQRGHAATAVMLRSPTKLELLDHGACPDGTPSQEIDKVRVIDGPMQGSEGWVITSEVWRPLPLR